MINSQPSKDARKKRRRVVRLFREQGGKCIYCKTEMWLPYELDDITILTGQRRPKKTRATLEHKIPLSKNGSKRKIENQAVSCHSCNTKKKDMSHFLFKVVHWNDKMYNFVMKIKKLYFKIQQRISK